MRIEGKAENVAKAYKKTSTAATVKE